MRELCLDGRFGRPYVVYYLAFAFETSLHSDAFPRAFQRVQKIEDQLPYEGQRHCDDGRFLTKLYWDTNTLKHGKSYRMPFYAYR